MTTNIRAARPTASLSTRVQDLLHCMAGAAPQLLARLDDQVRMQYATLGLVFLLNLLILVAVWIKVGVAYFGAVGVLVPGIAVPCLFVLGLDRLVAMRRRTLKDELAGFNLPGSTSRLGLEPVLRVAMAVALSALTTFTFLMSQSTDSIRHLQNEDARLANQGLRQDLTERALTTHSLRAGQSQAREQQLLADRKALQAQIEATQADLVQIESRARQSRDMASMEAGGLDRRPQGMGVKFHAATEMALHNEQAAADLRARLRQVQAQRESADKELAEVRGAADGAMSERNRSMGQLDEDMRLDSRFVTARRGLFADATAFVRLYADPQEAVGRWLLSILLVAVMFALECASLLALAMNPSSPMDVLRMATSREQAARAVAESEIAVAREAARSPAIEVRDWPLAEHNPRHPSNA